MDHYENRPYQGQLRKSYDIDIVRGFAGYSQLANHLIRADPFGEGRKPLRSRLMASDPSGDPGLVSLGLGAEQVSATT